MERHGLADVLSKLRTPSPVAVPAAKKKTAAVEKALAGIEERKATTVEERLEVVHSLIARCWSHSRIAWSLAKRWDVGRTQIYNYIHDVYARIHLDERDVTWEQRREAARLRLEQIGAAAFKAGNWTAATAAQDRLNRIDGLYQDRIELTGRNGGPITVAALTLDLTRLTDEELNQYESINSKLLASSPSGERPESDSSRHLGGESTP